MNDPHHIWNDGTAIRTRKRPCGCYVTAKTLILCKRAQDLKKSVDSCYKLWQSQKDTPIDTAIIRALFDNFEIHRKAYRGHVVKGDEWAE